MPLTTANIGVNPGTTVFLSAFSISRNGTTEKIEAIALIDPASGNPMTIDGSGRLTVNVAGTIPVSLTFPTTQPVSGTVAISGGSVTTVTDGTAATAITQDTGGAGAIGWFSSMVKNLRNILTAIQGLSTRSNMAIAVGITSTILKSGSGFLGTVLVTGVGSGNPLLIYDNIEGDASGVCIGYVPAGAQPGETFQFNQRVTVGISIPTTTNNPAVTLSFG